VVTARFRRRGIGTALVQAAVTWAEDAGYGRVRVRTNVVRQEAPALYRALGFELRKQQDVFERDLRADR
jgi:GNAT superfamily N-acetyltransferase